MRKDESTEPEDADADDENEPDDDQATLPAQTPATPVSSFLTGYYALTEFSLF